MDCQDISQPQEYKVLNFCALVVFSNWAPHGAESCNIHNHCCVMIVKIAGS